MKKFSENVKLMFESLGCEYEDVKDLMEDTLNGNLHEVTKKEAEGKIREMMLKVFNLDPEEVKNEKVVKRAIKKYHTDFFEIIEDVVDDMLVQNWQKDEFFEQFVEQKNLADGDANEFWSNDDVILSVAQVAGDHHDIILQRLGEGESYSVKTSTYACAVGTDIRLYLAGRKDWTELVNAVYRAFDKKIKDTMYAEVMNAGSQLPVNSNFNISAQLAAANKDAFDQLIEDVSAANGGVPIVIMGTSSACKKLEGLTDVDWISEGMKQEKHETGKVGFYEGTSIIEIPQRLKRIGKGTDATIERLVANDKLLILPMVENKFVKFVNVGDAEILEVTEQGARVDDTMKFEYQQSFGIGVQIGRYFGVYTITA